MESKIPSPTAGKTIRCKAAVSRNPGEPLIVEEIEVDPPQAWEVRIKILCTSLCHTDVTFWKLTSGPAACNPRILGHEGVGVVESVGEHVEEVKEGDVVLPVFQPHCKECRDCRSRRSNMCCKLPQRGSNGMPRDGSTRFRDAKGDPVFHFLCVSSFTEYTVVDVIHVVKIGPQIPIDKACLLSCGVSTGIGAAWKVAQVEEGSTAVIFGLGAIGLAVAEGLKLCKPSRIIGVDSNPGKFEIGRQFGVSDFIDSNKCEEKSISEVIKEMTDGGADYCFECVGFVPLMEEAFASTRKGGQTVILGVDGRLPLINISSISILQGRVISGSFFGGLKPKFDIPTLAKKYLLKEISLDGFITHEVGFHEINKAFELLLQGKSIRCIIWMDKLIRTS